MTRPAPSPPPGSFMTGQTQWAIIGSIMIILGVGLFIFANRRNKLPPSS
jgi:LPXTG-motif cell wall-anchored protein